jgi:hypothetical protein
MQNNSDAVLEKQLDKKAYSDDELISIKTTLNLPYYNSSPEFERAYGSITINGKDYEYVMRRVYHDTLEVLCLPNHARTKLQTVKNEITKATADGQASTPNKKSSTTLKISLPDFFQTERTSSPSFVTLNQNKYFSFDQPFLTADYSLQQERPPQSMQLLS